MYALGSVNFLFDKSEEPHIRADELCAAFGVSQSSGANKAKLIRDMFGMWAFDPIWTLPSLADKNPLLWMVEINGLIVDVRYMPARSARAGLSKGLNPVFARVIQLPEKGS